MDEGHGQEFEDKETMKSFLKLVRRSAQEAFQAHDCFLSFSADIQPVCPAWVRT